MPSNVGFITEDDGVFAPCVWLYLHRSMSDADLRFAVARALRRSEDRWDDPSYATVIAVGTLTGGLGGLRGHGFGLGTLMGANSGDAFIVDWVRRVVVRVPVAESEWFQFPEFGLNRTAAMESAQCRSFDEFLLEPVGCG